MFMVKFLPCSHVTLCALAITVLNILISKIQKSCSDFDDFGFDEGNIETSRIRKCFYWIKQVTVEVWWLLYCAVLGEQIEVLSEYVGFMFTIKNIFTLEVIKKDGMMIWLWNLKVQLSFHCVEWSVIKYFGSIKCY